MKAIIFDLEYVCTVSSVLCVQEEEGAMDDDVDTVVKMLMETESHFKELSSQFDQHFERWTSFTQVGVITLYMLLSTYFHLLLYTASFYFCMM